MEQKMSRHWPGFKVLCIVFLLGLENGALGSINPENLHKIIKYITGYGLKNIQYAVAVRLDADVCRDPSLINLKAALPESEMNNMHKAIDTKGGIYNPNPIQNVVAARPKGKGKKAVHAEWRLLTGGLNSLTAKMLENKQDNCLIFFSRWSPCIDRCLNPQNDKHLTTLLNYLFCPLDQDSKAFVFESVYFKDVKNENKENALKRIKHVPLFCCDDNECKECFENNRITNGKSDVFPRLKKKEDSPGRFWARPSF